MGYSPAPTAPTRIVGPDGVPLKGDVSLVPGNAQSILRQGNGFLLGASNAQRARGVECFFPGVLAARTGLVLPVPDAILTSLDVMLRVAPAGTDGANFAQVRVKGLNNGSASVALPLSTNAQGEYHLSEADLSPVVGTLFSPTTIGPISRKGVAQPFHPTTNLTIGGLAFTATDLKQAGFGVGPLRVGICDATLTAASGHTPNTVPWIKDAAGVNAFVDVTTADMLPSNGATSYFPYTPVIFPNPVSLVSGTTYRVVLIQQPTQNVANNGLCAGANNNTSGQNIVNDGGAFGAAVIRTGAGTDPATTLFDGTGSAFNAIPVLFLGSVLGTPLSGLVSIGVEITGAPATPGTDLQISAQL